MPWGWGDSSSAVGSAMSSWALSLKLTPSGSLFMQHPHKSRQQDPRAALSPHSRICSKCGPQSGWSAMASWSLACWFSGGPSSFAVGFLFPWVSPSLLQLHPVPTQGQASGPPALATMQRVDRCVAPDPSSARPSLQDPGLLGKPEAPTSLEAPGKAFVSQL